MTAPIRLSVPGEPLLPRHRFFGPPDDITEPLPVLSSAVLERRVPFEPPVVLDYSAPFGQTPTPALPVPVTQSALGLGIGRFVVVTAAQAITWCQLALAAMAVLLGALSGQAPVLIEGNSMQPSLQPGDVVILEAIDTSEPLVGRIVTFTNERGRVTHRIIEEPETGEYTTQGDASANPETELRSVGDFIGAGKAVVPKIGTPMIWFRQGRLALFGTWLVGTLAIAAVAIGGLSGSRDDDD